MTGRKEFRRVVVGLDGLANSQAPDAFVCRLRPPRGGRVTCVRVVGPVRVPSMPLLPSAMRAQIAGQARCGELDPARNRPAPGRGLPATLRRPGWRAAGLGRNGLPLVGLPAAVRAARAVLVVGARGKGAVTHSLLCSVAEAALKHAPVDVLIVK